MIMGFVCKVELKNIYLTSDCLPLPTTVLIPETAGRPFYDLTLLDCKKYLEIFTKPPFALVESICCKICTIL